MSRIRVGKRYAMALYDLCDDNLETAEAYHEILKNISQLYDDVHVARVLLSPVVKTETKSEILKEIMALIKTDRVMETFLDTVASSGRVDVIPNITESFLEIIHSKKNIVIASVTSAAKLSEDKIARLQEKLATETKKTVLLSNTVDPSIIGGLKISIGNSVLDLSLKTKLKTITDAAVI
ncbi:MAG: ATP synthase F1 subunit delta [Pseudobacteriovorax sp.]|nr:ATP synthase F1 subunit delta [Pseudobacteriovorax sp.]